MHVWVWCCTNSLACSESRLLTWHNQEKCAMVTRPFSSWKGGIWTQDYHWSGKLCGPVQTGIWSLRTPTIGSLLMCTCELESQTCTAWLKVAVVQASNVRILRRHSFVPRPHLQGEGLVTFGWFLGLPYKLIIHVVVCCMHSCELITNLRANVSPSWSSQGFLVLQPQIVFSAKWLVVEKFSAESNQRLNVTRPSPLWWCLGTRLRKTVCLRDFLGPRLSSNYDLK